MPGGDAQTMTQQRSTLAQRRAEKMLAEAMVGRRVEKDFGAHGIFRGVVTGVTPVTASNARPLYRIR